MRLFYTFRVYSSASNAVIAVYNRELHEHQFL